MGSTFFISLGNVSRWPLYDASFFTKNLKPFLQMSTESSILYFHSIFSGLAKLCEKIHVSFLCIKIEFVLAHHCHDAI